MARFLIAYIDPHVVGMVLDWRVGTIFDRQIGDLPHLTGRLCLTRDNTLQIAVYSCCQEVFREKDTEKPSNVLDIDGKERIWH